MHQISIIEHKLQKTGTKPESLMNAPKERNCFDRMHLPKKLKIITPCCKIRASFIICMLGVAVIDAIILLRYLIQVSEIVVYQEDYP